MSASCSHVPDRGSRWYRAKDYATLSEPTVQMATYTPILNRPFCPCRWKFHLPAIFAPRIAQNGPLLDLFTRANSLAKWRFWGQINELEKWGRASGEVRQSLECPAPTNSGGRRIDRRMGPFCLPPGGPGPGYRSGLRTFIEADSPGIKARSIPPCDLARPIRHPGKPDDEPIGHHIIVKPEVHSHPSASRLLL
jgi:hypothetical protein